MTMKQEQGSNINYQLPVIVHHCSDDLPGTLTVARQVDGKFWEGRLYVHPALHMTVEQSASPLNGGDFSHRSDESFLEHVRVVFGFRFGADFDFVSDNYRPSHLR
jgi:hypothetical protein